MKEGKSGINTQNGAVCHGQAVVYLGEPRL